MRSFKNHRKLEENAPDGKIRGSSGETLVEVLVSAMLFLIMMAVIQGAVAFCTNAQRKSQQIRSSNAEICNALRRGVGKEFENGEQELSFIAVSADGQQEGNQVFTVETKLERKEVSDSNGRQAAFFLFAPDTAAGGGSP